jgi:hypothetical protein
MAMDAARTLPPRVLEPALARERVTNAAAGTLTDRMSERSDDNANDAGSWPLPSSDVLRELDPPALVWSESDSAASWPIRPTARD